MMRLTEVVKNLLIINVILFIGTLLILGEATPEMSMELINEPDPSKFREWRKMILALFYPTSEYFKPFQLVTHMFMHSDLRHLFFNMFGIFMFGPPLENYFGPKKFLQFYFFSGLGAFLLHLLITWGSLEFMGAHPDTINIPMLGASGALFGILIGYAMQFPNSKLMIIPIPFPIKAKVLVGIYVVASLVMGIGNIMPGVAHFAHLGGGLFGFLLIYYWRKNGNLFNR